MKLRARCWLDINEYRKRGVMRYDNLIILKHDDDSRERIQKELYKINDKNLVRIAEGKETVELDVVIDINYSERSLSQNALMWKLYDVLAEALNREAGTRYRVSPESLYEEDMKEWAPRHRLYCDKESLPFFKIVLEEERGKIRAVRELPDGKYEIEVWRTSSYWNTVEMNNHIDRLLNTLEQMGVIAENNGKLDAIMRDIEKWRATL